MSAIDNLIQVSITKETSAVDTASFSIPLIVGKSQPGWSNGDVVRTYTDAAGLLADGFNTSSPEYLYAATLMSQDLAPAEFMVGLRQPSAGTGSHTLITIDFGTSSYYGLVLNGYGFFVAGSDQASVATQLAAAINVPALPGVMAAVTTGNNVQVTTSGNASFNGSQYDGITVGEPASDETVSVALAQSLSLISAQNDNWYYLILAEPSDDDTLAAAAYVEALKKMCFSISKADDCVSSADDDVLSKGKSASYDRTVVVYSPAGFAKGTHAGWVGLMASTTPGAAAWSYKNLNGVTADKLSANQLSTLYGSPVSGVAGKNGNVYTPFAGTNCTYPGIALSGQFIDVTVGVDWLQARIQEAIFALLTSVSKVPYTDAGCAMLLSTVQNVLQTAVGNGLIDGKDPDYPVKATVPAVDSVSKNQRANRIAPTISFVVRLQGALNSVIVNGTVTV